MIAPYSGCAETRLLIKKLCVHCTVLDDVVNDLDQARNAARMLWMMFSYREKEERDKGQTEWLKANCLWLQEE
jgi:hypothetical protein